MKILLTGAGGFTGHHFVLAAETSGHIVHRLAADLTDEDAVRGEVRGVEPDACVHLAAISFVGHADNEAFYRVNVVGTLHLLAALASLYRKPASVLLASSANVYGNCDASPINETQPVAPVNHYAMSKLAMEHMSRTYSDRLPIVLTRPFNYTGPGQAKQFLIPKLVRHFAQKAPRIELGNLQVEREFNDVRMVCDAYLKLLTRGQSGEVYNVCSGLPYSLAEVVNTLSAITGHSLALSVNPAFVRANEVHRLCGAPEKLLDCIGDVGHYSLTQTLEWMLRCEEGETA